MQDMLSKSFSAHFIAGAKRYDMLNTREIICDCRDSLKWTRVRLSEKSGVSIDTIVKVEKKRGHNVSVNIFEKLLNAMGYELKVVRKDMKEFVE